MILQICSFPNTKLVDPKTVFSGNHTGQHILDLVESNGHDVDDDTTIIIDHSAQIKHITIDDPVAQYYRARLGDIFRIRDGKSVSYRQVVKQVTLPASSAPKRAPLRDATPELYFNAYDTVISMIKDRQSQDQHEATDALRISEANMRSLIVGQQWDSISINGLPSKKGQRIYVRFIDKMAKITSINNIKTVVTDACADCIAHYNNNYGGSLSDVTTEDKAEINSLNREIDIIVIFNNTKNLLIPNLGFGTDCYQIFAVQNLSFNVTKYADQPEFTLLDARLHRAELRDIYKQNGRIIGKDGTLESFGLKDNTKLIVI